MAEFVISTVAGGSKTVEAHHFHEEGSLVVFKSSATGRGTRVYAVPTFQVKSIERTEG
ncbi:hypothetical protein [Nocardia sp. NPDC057227]|uniref:hypothetical protein n=1 Tax=Nocardia sp. NPDC057227 TaxID=3346056 RepID=UPI00363FA401